MSKMTRQQLRQRLMQVSRARNHLRRQAAQWRHEADVLRRKADDLLEADVLLAEEEAALRQFLREGMKCHA